MTKHKVKEQAIQRACLERLNAEPGCYAFRVQTTGVYDVERKCFRTNSTQKGVADILAIFNGMLLAFEIKRAEPKTYATKEQKEFGERIKKAGGHWSVARSIEDVELVLAQIKDT